MPCPQLQAWLEVEQGLPAGDAEAAAWQLALAYQSEQAALAGLPATFEFCRSRQLTGPEAAQLLCGIAKLRWSNISSFASSAQLDWLLLERYFDAHVKQLRQEGQRLPKHLSFASMLRSNKSAARALVMQPGHLQRWLDAVGERLSAADICAVLAKEPEVVSAAPEKAAAALDWAASQLGPQHVAPLVRCTPGLLQAEVATLQHKLNNIQAAAGVTQQQAVRLVLKFPNVLVARSDKKVRAAAEWLRRYFPSTGEVTMRGGCAHLPCCLCTLFAT